jgi:hypothetical protein
MKFSDVPTTDLSVCLFRDFLICLVIETTDLRWPGGDFSLGSGSRGGGGSRGGSREIEGPEIDLDNGDSREFTLESEGQGGDCRVTHRVGAIERWMQRRDDGGCEEDDLGCGLRAEL